MKKDTRQVLNDVLITNLENLIHKTSTWEHETELLKEILSESDFDKFSDVTLTECHIIDCIGKNETINAVGISQKLSITKGGISKATARLLKKGMLKTHRLEGNKKEIFYTLTPLGQEVFLIHKNLHSIIREKCILLFEKYSIEDLNLINSFFSEFTETI